MVDMIAARIAASSTPPIHGLHRKLISLIKTSSLAFLSKPGKMGFARKPITTAAAREITTQIVAMIVLRGNNFALLILMKRVRM